MAGKLPAGWEEVTPQAASVPKGWEAVPAGYEEVPPTPDSTPQLANDISDIFYRPDANYSHEGRNTYVPSTTKDYGGRFPMATPTEGEDFYPGLAKRINAGAEALANTVVGGIGFFGGQATAAADPITSRLFGPYRDAQGNPLKTFPQIANRVASDFASPLYNESSDLGQEWTDKIGEAFNAVGIPMMGLHLGVPQPMRGIKAKGIDLAKLNEAPKPASIPAGWEEVGPPRPPLQVTPEGQAFDPRMVPEYVRKNAEDMQKRAQEGLDRSTEGITYENVPPDAVIPRDAQSGNLRVPRGNEWVPDENGIPVRQGLPEEPLEKPVQNVDVNQPHVNDMGNAIQEANGPILGAGEIYGAGPLNKQSGVLNMDMFDPAFKIGKELDNGIRLLLRGSKKGPVVLAYDKAGNRVGEVGFTHDQFLREVRPTDNLEAQWVTTDPNKMTNRPDADRLGPTTPSKYKGLAAEMYKFASELGNDIVASGAQTTEGQAMWKKWEEKGFAKNRMIPASQMGAFDYQAFHDAAQRGMDRFAKFIEDVGGAKVSPHTPEEKVVTDILGNKNYNPKGDAPDTIIKNALGQADHPELWKNFQSGLQHAGQKVQSALMQGVARWNSWANKEGQRGYNLYIRPFERMLASLKPDDLVAAQAALRKGMFEGKEYSDAQLKSAGLSPKAIEAYKQHQKVMDDALRVTNDSLRRLGRKEITKQEAYMASMWSGNWHMPIKDKEGNLAWYVKVGSKGEAQRALNYLKNDPELSKTLDFEGVEPKYYPESVGRRTPADVMGAYQNILHLFEGEMSKHIKAAMEAYIENQGFKYQQHQKHFQNKINVRGFQGDRPWLSERENATAQAKAQVTYLKEAYNWAPMQEALANLKEVFSHKELNDQQPANMALARAYTAQTMGISKSLFKDFEHAVQEITTSMPEWAGKIVPGELKKFVGSLKTMTYLTQLGLSAGYMIATPLQAFLLGPARHMKLSSEGIKHNFLETSIKALYDFSVGVTGHEINNVVNNKYNPPMTPLGKEAFKYMEDNGIITQNVFHEASGLGEYKAVHGLKQAIGWSISMPEKIARAATFMSFVHHLDASGKFTSRAELFRRAEELTNHTLTDFRRIERPLIVDKLGNMGELLYTYKSAVFNQYNHLMEFARDARKGKPGPLLSALGMTAVLGGMTSMPLVNELDEAWELIKTGVSHVWPTLYPKISGLGVKGRIIATMNSVAANDKLKAAIGEGPAKFVGQTGGYGAVSAATGAQMASRFSSAIGDISNPLQNMAPVGQEMREWLGAGASMANPTKDAAVQAVYSAIAPPAVKGIMENNYQGFKTVKQPNGQGYDNPNNFQKRETQYIRSPQEESMRNWGLTSLQEATTKNANYINMNEKSRFRNAQEASMDKMFNAVVEGKKDDVQKYAQAYFANNGLENFESDFDKKIEKFALTPQQRNIIHSESLNAIKAVLRQRELEGK